LRKKWSYSESMLIGHEAINISSYFDMVLGKVNVFGIFNTDMADVPGKLNELRDNMESFETYLRTTPGIKKCSFVLINNFFNFFNLAWKIIGSVVEDKLDNHGIQIDRLFYKAEECNLDVDDDADPLYVAVQVLYAQLHTLVWNTDMK
jgi:hypothetical protein